MGASSNGSGSLPMTREALRLGYRGADAHHNYGVALVLQGRHADAAVAFEQAVAANPQHAAAWNNLGGLSERAGRLDEAVARYQQAVDAAPADASMRFNLGRMLIANGRARDSCRTSKRSPAPMRPTHGTSTARDRTGPLRRCPRREGVRAAGACACRFAGSDRDRGVDRSRPGKAATVTRSGTADRVARRAAGDRRPEGHAARGRAAGRGASSPALH